MREQLSKMHGLSKFNRFTSLAFILFLTLHFLVLLPVIHYACLCPEVDPDWKCTCMCAKCAARKSQAGRPADLITLTSSAKKPHHGLVGRSGYAPIDKGRLLGIPGVSVETMACDCKGMSKNIASELKVFIPMLIFGILISTIAYNLILSNSRLYPAEFLPPFERPG